MDFLRAPYRTTMRLFESDQTAYPVRWYFCKAGAKPFPEYHRFASGNYSDPQLRTGVVVPTDWPGVGEILYAPRPFVVPIRPDCAEGKRYVGTPDDFIGKGTPSIVPVPYTTAGQLAACCGPPPPPVVVNRDILGDVIASLSGVSEGDIVVYVLSTLHETTTPVPSVFMDGIAMTPVSLQYSGVDQTFLAIFYTVVLPGQLATFTTDSVGEAYCTAVMALRNFTTVGALAATTDVTSDASTGPWAGSLFPQAMHCFNALEQGDFNPVVGAWANPWTEWGRVSATGTGGVTLQLFAAETFAPAAGNVSAEQDNLDPEIVTWIMTGFTLA